MRNCMPPMACGAAGERTGSFSSVSSTGEVLGEEFRMPYHGKPPFLAGSPPEIGEDDGDLRLVIAGTSDPLSAPPAAAKKKKRSLPGTPDIYYYPSAEVIALSPRTLMATNRFVCEICHKGFQRDQNLQLHRRGHNLPWKLRQRGAEGAPPRKRAYVCPEPACVHHDPRRALGDLTGIKKHFCRKHGEKKWKCERCAKRYAVHSDWKAHSKVCGTREYRCDCGTLFSRRDSFVTHRAFCDALAQENSKLAQPAMNMATVASALQGQQQAHAHHHLMGLPPSTHADHDDMDADDASGFPPDIKSPHLKMFSDDTDADNPLGCMLSSLGATPSAFSPSSRLGMLGLGGPSDAAMGGSGGCYSPGSSSLASMSATALLQKAAQMGATTTTSDYGVSFAHGHAGLASTMAGLDRFPAAGPFGPMRPYVPYNGMTQDVPQLVGFDVAGPMPGQLYNGGANGTTTRTVGGSAVSGAGPDQMEERRRVNEDVRVVDYMGVEHQRSFGSVGSSASPFPDHTGPWA